MSSSISLNPIKVLKVFLDLTITKRLPNKDYPTNLRMNLTIKVVRKQFSAKKII